MKQVFGKLRKYGKSDYRLLRLCNFLADLLITAFAFIICSPTIQDTFPDNGDSMKQVMIIFVLALAGCLIFTAYAAALFFRYKSREIGVLLALGAGKRSLGGQLFLDLGISMVLPGAGGILLGAPFAWGIWQIFRLFLVDKSGTVLTFTSGGLAVGLAFLSVSLAVSCLLGLRFLAGASVMDVVNTQRRSEPIRDVKGWYLPVGILLCILGAVLGYGHTGFFVNVLKRMPPGWMQILYLPILPGIYMIILYAVIRGRKKRRHPYQGIISRSMMKFQGRQTVNNMVVMTILVAGACFALFYAPMTSAGLIYDIESWERDVSLRLRKDLDLPDRQEIRELAVQYGVELSEWQETEVICLGRDGVLDELDEETGRFTEEYRKIIVDALCLSESGYEKLTGQEVQVEAGTCDSVVSKGSEEDSAQEAGIFTNMSTGRELEAKAGQIRHYRMLSDCVILNDQDFQKISEGLQESWRETFVLFDLAGDKDQQAEYGFAKALYQRILDGSEGAGLDSEFYSRAVKADTEKRGEEYWADSDPEGQFTKEEQGTFSFQTLWKYRPQIRVLEEQDLITRFAVLFMTFVFMALVCFTSVLIISYTRSLTVALGNRQVYQDLEQLGAGVEFRYDALRRQISKIYQVPTILGMLAILGFFSMILYVNDGKISPSEGMGLLVCVVLELLLAAVLFGFYRKSLKKVCQMLGVKRRAGGSWQEPS